MNAVGTYAAASAGLDILSGLFGYFVAQEAAGIAESRGRLLRLEAEADAQRYAEAARGFSAKQRLAYLKSGVYLSGSPLDVLDRDMLTAEENISAIRARGAAGQLDAEGQAAQERLSGRQALISGITGGVGKVAMASYLSGKTKESAKITNNTPNIERQLPRRGRFYG